MHSPLAAPYELLARATAKPGIVAVCGPRGLGKTWFVRAYVRATPGRVLTVLDARDDLDTTLTADLLARSRGERIVLTMRSRPRSARVQVVALAPWPVLDPGASADELLVHPTLRLFFEHAGLQAPPERSELRLAARIVTHLEGIPELVVRAAERASRLGVTAVAELVTDPSAITAFYAERDGGKGAYAAFVQQRLAALALDAQHVARAAALFPGGFELRALSAVTGTLSKHCVILALDALLDAGLLVAGEHGRFVMLRPERELVAKLLGQDGDHIERFVRALVAETAAGPTVDASPRALHARPNVEFALDLAAAAHDAEASVTLTRWLGRLYLASGPVATFVELADNLVNRFERDELRGDASYAEALWLRGMARIGSGAHGQAATDFAAASSSRDPSIRALALSKCALLQGLAGNAAAAAVLVKQASEHAAMLPAYVRGELAKDEANLLAETSSERVYAQLLLARAIFRKAGYAREEAFLVMMLAGRACDRGELDSARKLCKRSIALFEKVGDRRSPAWVLCLSGLVEQEAQKFHRAANRFRRARKCARAYGDDLTAALATGFFAGLALERAALDDALDNYALCTEYFRRIGAASWVAYFEAGAASAQAELGRFELAAEASARSVVALAQGRPARYVAASLLALSIDAVRASRPGELATLAQSARRLVEAAPAEESRWALRVLTRQLAARGLALVPGPFEILTVGPNAEWFRIGTNRVELRRRHVLKRVFAYFALAPPGTRISTSELVRHVWSGEHVSASAAANRLYVAIARLRTEGLADVLVQEGDGYFLACPIDRVQDE